MSKQPWIVFLFTAVLIGQIDQLIQNPLPSFPLKSQDTSANSQKDSHIKLSLPFIVSNEAELRWGIDSETGLGFKLKF